MGCDLVGVGVRVRVRIRVRVRVRFRINRVRVSDPNPDPSRDGLRPLGVHRVDARRRLLGLRFARVAVTLLARLVRVRVRVRVRIRVGVRVRARVRVEGWGWLARPVDGGVVALDADESLAARLVREGLRAPRTWHG